LLIWTCVASCDEFCIFEKLYVETFRIFLNSCIVNKGEKFVHDLGTWDLSEGVPVGLGKL
jgi:hypothetical protein